MLDDIGRAEEGGDLPGVFHFAHAIYDDGLGKVEIFSIAQGHDIDAKIAQFCPDLTRDAARAASIEDFHADIGRDLRRGPRRWRWRLPKGTCRKGDQTCDGEAAENP